MPVHSRIHSSRPAPILFTGSVYGASGTSANCWNTFGSAVPLTRREHEHLQRDVGLELLGEQEVDELAGRGFGARSP